VHLQEVDLRWGVDTLSLDEEIAREQKILSYCLDEARRCAPYILILLGDRYGYLPTGLQFATSGAADSDAPCETDGRSVTELEVDACLTATGQPPRHRAFLPDPGPQYNRRSPGFGRETPLAPRRAPPRQCPLQGNYDALSSPYPCQFNSRGSRNTP
jgi:hypothetical protein